MNSDRETVERLTNVINELDRQRQNRGAFARWDGITVVDMLKAALAGVEPAVNGWCSACGRKLPPDPLPYRNESFRPVNGDPA